MFSAHPPTAAIEIAAATATALAASMVAEPGNGPGLRGSQVFRVAEEAAQGSVLEGLTPLAPLMPAAASLAITSAQSCARRLRGSTPKKGKEERAFDSSPITKHDEVSPVIGPEEEAGNLSSEFMEGRDGLMMHSKPASPKSQQFVIHDPDSRTNITDEYLQKVEEHQLTQKVDLERYKAKQLKDIEELRNRICEIPVAVGEQTETKLQRLKEHSEQNTKDITDLNMQIRELTFNVPAIPHLVVSQLSQIYRNHRAQKLQGRKQCQNRQAWMGRGDRLPQIPAWMGRGGRRPQIPIAKTPVICTVLRLRIEVTQQTMNRP